MKKMLSLLLALMMLFVSLTALAEGGGTVKLELNTAKLQVYAANSPKLEGLKIAEDNTLPVIVLSARKSVQLQVNVTPKTVKNKKVTLTSDNEAIARVKGNSVTGQKPGQAVLTIASAQDPSVKIQYRIVVIQPITRITLTAPAKSVGIGGTMQLKPAYTPADASRKEVTWTSANPQIATVDKNGVVTGLKRGNARITATATDGSNIRANISIQVTQSAQKITLDKSSLTIDVGRNAMLKATVLPQDTNNKKVVWSSSNAKVATVDKQGRVNGVSLGDCEIICASEEAGNVLAKAAVHVQQPVKKVAFGPAPAVYNNETAQLTWTIDPANASNPKLSFASSNERILTVDQNGAVTGVTGGEATVTATTTDGSRRQAKVKVKVLQHLTGVHMLRKTAYIDFGTTSTAGAVLEPEKAKNVNPNMTWESADPSIASVRQNAKAANKVDITGVAYGMTEIYGTTEDGGFRTALTVRVGDWENSLKITNAHVEGADAFLTLKNVGTVNITSITAEVTVYDIDGKVVPSNRRDPSKPFKLVYTKTLEPGASTRENGWKTVDFMLPDSLTVSDYVIRVTQFEIEHDWVKVLPRKKQPSKKCPVHI